MRILLVSNYAPDKQESMLRFAAALHAGLCGEGIQAELIRPEVRLGKWKSGPSGLGKWLGYLDKFVLFPRVLRQRAAEANLVHICDHSNAIYVKAIRNRPHLVTCNDMLAIRSAAGEFPDHRTRATGRILQRWILAGLRLARRITCISKATRDDVLRLTGQPAERVSVTYMGQNYAYAPDAEIAAASEKRRRGGAVDHSIFEQAGLPAMPYLLQVGGSQWYKNRPGALNLYGRLRETMGDKAPRLILVGPPVSPLPPGVEVRSEVSNEALTKLYSGAELLVFPSLEEGFGWPIIEAQACGCPVLTTGKAPMTEVGGDAAVYLQDPHDAEEGARRAREILEWTESARAEIVRSGIANAARFSLERMTREYIAIYQEILGVA